MKVTIIKDDGVVGVDGVFKKITVSDLPTGVRVVQWDSVLGTGHVEYYDDNTPNSPLSSIAAYQIYIDDYNLPPQLPVIPTDVLIANAHARIQASYSAAVNAVTAAYPKEEQDSWFKQEQEARAWTANNSVSTPWIDAAVTARGIAKSDLVTLIITNADAFTALSGQYTGKRQSLRDQITALGSTPSQAQLDAIKW
jgi:hypothetical protein